MDSSLRLIHRRNTIGVDTQYLTDLGTSTKWIGVDPWFGTTTYATSIGPSSTTVITAHKQFSVSTAPDGSLDIAMSDELKDIFEGIFQDLPSCGVPGRGLGIGHASHSKGHLPKRQTCEARLQAASQAINEQPALSSAFQQLSDDIVAAMGLDPADLDGMSQMIGFGTDTAEEMNSLLAQLFPGVSLEALQGGALAAAAAGGLWITLEGMWNGLQMITYKFHADPIVYDVPYIAPSQTTPPPVSVGSTDTSTKPPCPTDPLEQVCKVRVGIPKIGF